MSLSLSNFIGTYQTAVFVILQLLYLLGFVYEVILILDKQGFQGKKTTFIDAARYVFWYNPVNSNSTDSASPEEDICLLPRPTEKSATLVSESEEEKVGESSVAESETSPVEKNLARKSVSLDADIGKALQNEPEPKASKSTDNVQRSIAQERNFLKKLKIDFKMSLDIEDERVNTENHMYFALYACVGMLLWKHKWMIQLLSLPIAYYLIKQIGSSCGFWTLIDRQYNAIVNTIAIWCKERHQALVPAHVRGLYKLGVIVNNKITEALKGSVDAVATTAVILALLFFTTCASIFITIQVRKLKKKGSQ